MNDIITKDSLERSMGFISELELNEVDYENIFTKFKPVLENHAIKSKLDKLGEIEEDDSLNNLETIIKKILDTISVPDLNFILDKIIKNEDLTNFIQDLILEKLI